MVAAEMGDACTIGVDVGGTKLLAGVVDEGLAVHARVRRRVPREHRGVLLDTIVEAVGEALHAAPAPVTAVGLGVACIFDHRRGVAVSSVHLPLAEVPLGAVLAERLGLPVAVDNDATVATLLEWRHGAAAGARDAVMLTIGTGVGGGLVVGGALARGALGAGGELGHMVVDADGPPCAGSCPGRGCLEALVSGPALGREAARLARERPGSVLGRALAAGREPTGALVGELAHDGDEAALEILRRAGRWLGVGVTSLVNALNPEVVVMGGGVLGAGELLLEPVREVVAARALVPARDAVRIVPARFGEDAGMLGAATLAGEARASAGRAA
jgi:glucokinase